MKEKQDHDRVSHRRKVQEIARKYKRIGYTVNVDGVRGYNKPAKVGTKKYRPDIEVTSKSGKRIIIEVKSSISLSRNKSKLETLARSAAHREHTDFHLIISNPRKHRSK